MNKRFIRFLDEALQSSQSFHDDFQDSIMARSQSCPEGFSLQMVVLDRALQTLVEKYQKHLDIIAPALDQLLAMTEKNHEASDLKELMAARISLAKFERNMGDVTREINAFSREQCGPLSLVEVQRGSVLFVPRWFFMA